MALGFGFNKAKVLSAAEKFVQQGKLQNAIAEYEKVTKEDPKDLTVLNAIGDLYARVGQNDKASEYFKKVGDQYAQNGFTVKAIAVYKKLTRLSTAADAIIKLAELYTQQGLFNDARTHYMQIADQLLKSGDNNQAAKVFQKILELDPENATTQSKLADLYIKLGRREEALNIYQNAAESLYARKAFDAADEALSRVISLQPENSQALLLRGMIASESGDNASAIQYLEQVPDIDSRPDALRSLLNAKLHSGLAEGTEALAVKLFTVHQDLNGIAAVAEWQATHHREEDALKLYDQYADRFLAQGSATIMGTLYPLISRMRNNPPALDRILSLLRKAGDTSHISEVLELLAHAKVQSGDFALARDFYKELSELEPENPLHTQNYRQMLSKLGEDSVSRPLTVEENSQALMVEELEHTSPTVQQEYSPTVEKAIEAALTDAELFISYNVPLKAIAPLETVLPIAPRDLRLNQRLASLYVRAGRFADAVRACNILSEIYAQFGHQAEADRYTEEAKKYGLRVPEQRPAATTVPAAATPPPRPLVAPPAPGPEATIKEFVLDVPEEFFESPPAAAASTAQPAVPLVEPTVREFLVEAVTEAPESAAASVAQPDEIEIDVSHEWESMLTVEPQHAIETSAPAEIPPMIEAVRVESLPAAPPEPVAELPKAFAIPLEPVAAAPAPVEIPLEPVAAPSEPLTAAPDAAAIEDKVQEIRFYISQSFWDMARAALHDLSEMAPENPALHDLKAAISEGEMGKAAPASSKAPPTPPPPPVVVTPPSPAPTPIVVAPPAPPPPVVVASPPAPPPPVARPARPTPPPPMEVEVVDDDLVLDLGDDLPSAAKAVSEPPRAVPAPSAPPQAKAPEEDILGELVSDLEDSLGDFVPAGVPPERPRLEPPIAAIPPRPASAPPPVVVSSVAKAAASSESNGGMQDSEAASVLSDILSELQHDLGEDTSEAEDPETHYNLGIAFKEMGLLDEAIGELQKVCHAVEVGNSFDQPVQAYTWLAQCLVDKGVPEAAVRWYQQALRLPGLDHSSRCAIYYDLGSAYEASGDKKSALANFMEVYSSNIDFRDVASRIKVLKS